MIDNVIDHNYYSVHTARHSNMMHRSVGLGVMGFQNELYMAKRPYVSEDAIEFADSLMEAGR